jgi:hypothetical protein
MLVGAWIAFATTAQDATLSTGRVALWALCFAYGGWALVWGAPSCWKWLWQRRSIFAGVQRIDGAGKVLTPVLVASWLVWGAIIGSALGAGIYQFLRYRQTSPPAQPGTTRA